MLYSRSLLVIYFIYMASLVAQTVKASAYNAGDWGSIPGWGKSLEKEMVTHSSILAWKIPWTEEPDRLQSMGSKSRTRLSNFTSLHFIYSSVNTSIPISHFISLCLPPVSHKFVFYTCNSFCFVNKVICTLLKISTYKRYHIYLSLSDLLH